MDARASFEARLGDLRGRRITAVAGAGYNVDLPWAVRLDFDTGPVWFVAAMPQPPEMRTFFAPADEIVVAFSAGTVRAMGFDGV